MESVKEAASRCDVAGGIVPGSELSPQHWHDAHRHPLRTPTTYHNNIAFFSVNE